MKKTLLVLVAIVAVVGLFSLFNFFINSPTGFGVYYSPYGLNKCVLLKPDSSLGYDACVRQGVSMCKAMYFAEPGILTGWDYCYDICHKYVYDACYMV